MTTPPERPAPDPREGARGSVRRARRPFPALALACGVLLPLAGCAVGGSAARAPAPDASPMPLAGAAPERVDGVERLTFVDLDDFDERLAMAMRRGVSPLEVAFVGRAATVYDVPPRLRVWLDAVADRDDGLTIEYTDGLERKDLALIAALASGGYRLFVDARRRRTVRDYRARLVVDPDDASIRTIRFLR